MSEGDPIEVVKNDEAHRFEVHAEGHLAVAEYEPFDGGIIFTHTEVPAELGGRGIASKLVEAGLADARARGLRVVPRCEVFVRYMQKRPQTHDLLHPAAREALGLPAE